MLELLLILLYLLVDIVARLGVKKFESAIRSDQFLIDRAILAIFFKAGHEFDGWGTISDCEIDDVDSKSEDYQQYFTYFIHCGKRKDDPHQ